MNAFRKLSQNLKTLNLPQLLTETLDEYDKEIVEAVQEQLRYGKRGDGSSMGKYSSFTIQSKKDRGTVLMGERIALIDTGEFWQSMFATPYDDMVEVDSKDWKRDELIERYGEEIFQISPEQWKHIYSLAEADFKRRVNQWLNQ